MKYAAHVGNKHARARVTPFFDTPGEAAEAGNKTDHADTFVAPCANWEEHQRWNKERTGMYAQMPVKE